MRPIVRDVFTTDAVWTSRDRLVRSARWAIANVAAAPMLLLYAFGQPATVCSALAIAPVLFAGSTLVILRRTAGVLVLAAGGLALIAHAVATRGCVAVATDAPITAFWLPAAVLALFAGGVVLWRIPRSGSSRV